MTAVIDDPTGIVFAGLVVASALLLIPLDQWLDRRRAAKRRDQAHVKRKAGRW